VELVPCQEDVSIRINQFLGLFNLTGSVNGWIGQCTKW